MKAVIAIDSFKGSLTSIQAGNAVAEGIHRVYPDAKTKICPVADGGEGTVDALVTGLGGERVRIPVHGPLGDTVSAEYGILPESGTAIIEMSAAAGITLVSQEKRNPMITSTFGVGELILAAAEKGCRDFIIGIGGSATNDGGSGMLQALGFRLLDKNKNPISPGAEGLADLEQIDPSEVPAIISECSFSVACDVTNPLCGPQGCSAVYGPQKGADTEMIQLMDSYLGKYAEIAAEIFPQADPDYPGAGAAGGLGFAFRTFLNAKLERGITLIIEKTGLEKEISEADIVIVGEGRLDAQTAMGKAPCGIAAAAKKYGKPVVAFSGCVAGDASACNKFGIDAFFPILGELCSLEHAMRFETASENLIRTSEQVFRLIRLMH